MGIYFNGFCDSLQNFEITSEGSTITVNAEPMEYKGDKSIVFTASNGDAEYKVLLRYIHHCSFEISGYDNDEGSAVVSFVLQPNEAHWDNGFYHGMCGEREYYCTYYDSRIISIDIVDDKLYFGLHIPSSVKNGMILEEFNFKYQAYQFLVCLAKLCGNYVYSVTKCGLLDNLCPKLSDISNTHESAEFQNAIFAMAGD